MPIANLTSVQKGGLFIASWVHFLTDAVSAFVVLSVSHSLIFFLIYNFIAFALQPLLGFLFDLQENRQLKTKSAPQLIIFWFGVKLIVGLALLMLSLFMVSESNLLAVITVGLANSILHLALGKQVIDFNLTSCYPTGFFVSFGALGLFIGGQLIIHQSYFPTQLFILITICLITLFVVTAAYLKWGLELTSPAQLKKQLSHLDEKNKLFYQNKVWLPVVAIFFLCLAIVIRSALGLGLSFSWKAGDWLTLSILAIFAGKWAGGFLADKFGWWHTAVSGLIISLICLIFAFQIPVFGILALFTFQWPMSIAMMALVHHLSRWRATAFGLNCLSLFIGFLPISLLLWSFSNFSILLLLLMLLAIVSLGVGLYNYLHIVQKRTKL